MPVERLTVAKWKSAVVGNGPWPIENGLGMRERYIALVIAVHMDNTGETWVSLNRLAAESCQSKHTVKKYVDRLEEKGWLLRVKGRSGQSAHSFATVPKPVHSDDTASENESGAVSARGGALSAKSGAPRQHPNSGTPKNSGRNKFEKEIPDHTEFEKFNRGEA